MMESNTTQTHKLTHWADNYAQRIISERGSLTSDHPHYICASGITPSGAVHIGNFREIISVDMVVRALRSRNQPVRFLYFWDDYDAFRAVPSDLPRAEEYRRHLRKPLDDIPALDNNAESYAREREAPIERQLPLLGISAEYMRQSQCYRDGRYADSIQRALRHRDELRSILNRYRTEPLAKDWWPISIYSGATNKDTTTILEWDREWRLRYRCDETAREEWIDFRDGRHVKLLWRIDWPMRWQYYGVDFEPAGKDHHSEGGSFDSAKRIAKEVYNYPAPVSFRYDFIRIKGQGGKMSSSSGGTITLADALAIYQPEVLRHLFAGTRPNSEFAISFDLDVIKLYEDYDRCERIYYEETHTNEKKALKQRRIYELSQIDRPRDRFLPLPPFRHLCNLVQIVDGDEHKARELANSTLRADKSGASDAAHLNASYQTSLLQRIRCAKQWISQYAPPEFTFHLRSIDEVEPSPDELASSITRIINYLKQANGQLDAELLHNHIYHIANETNIEPKRLFTAIYRVLIGKDRGPRLASFIALIGVEPVVSRLERSLAS